MLKIPLGKANFSIIRKNNYFYVDKTKFLYQLIILDSPFFLSRPRRFGKSLLVSALKAILEGRRELFKGLWIDQTDYDWTPRPVIRRSLDNVSADSVARLEKDLFSLIKDLADREGVTFNSESPGI
ncbi:MAG: AAA family ATPase, partial [Deltaproteobacteria bacterium]|nr:AAA family ATPase [Deltaproteobacteria bacterium]